MVFKNWKKWLYIGLFAAILTTSLGYSWKYIQPMSPNPIDNLEGQHNQMQELANAAEIQTEVEAEGVLPELQSQPQKKHSPNQLNTNSGDLMPEQGPPLPSIPEEFQEVIARESLVEMTDFQTHFAHAISSQAENIALAASRINGQWINPGEIFSYNHTAGPFERNNGYGEGRMFSGNRIVPSIGGGVCQVSSTLYNVVLRANLPVVERHQHSLTVPYLQPGRDATVVYGALDFRFKNNLDKPILLVAGTQNRWIWIRLYGPEKPDPVRLEHKILSRTKPSVIREASSELKAGETEVYAPGQDGVQVHTWKIIETSEGEKRVDLGVDTYKPSPKVIRYGT